MAFYGTVSDRDDIKLLATRLLPEDHAFLKILDRAERDEIYMDTSIGIVRNSWGNHYSHFNTMTVSGEIIVYDNDDDDTDDTQMEEIETAFNEFEKAVQEDVCQVSKNLEGEGYKLIEAGNPGWFANLNANYSDGHGGYKADWINKRIGRFRVVVTMFEDQYFDPYDYDDEDAERIIKKLIDGETCFYGLSARVYDAEDHRLVGTPVSGWGIHDSRDLKHRRQVARELVAEAIDEAREAINRLSVRAA